MGREEKRRLRVMMHALVNGRLLPEEVARLRGKLAFIFSIDPRFVESLCSKNSFAHISDIELSK